MSSRKRYDRNRDIRRSIPQKEIIISNESNIEPNSETYLPDLDIPTTFSERPGDSTSVETRNYGDFNIAGKLPDEKARSIKYVPDYLVDQIVQAINDETLFSNTFFTFLGSLIGLILSWTTQEIPLNQLPKTTVIAGILIFIFSLLLFWFMKREKYIKEKKLNDLKTLFLD